jgi:septum formation protein
LTSLILASASEVRAELLRQSGIVFTVEAARIDEDMIKESLLQEGAAPRDIAVALAELKARKISASHPDALVIGADEILAFCGRIVNKSLDLAEARALLASLSGKSHELISAAALAKDGSVVWRTVSTVEMQMRAFSDAFLDDYLAANGEEILSSVGAYRFEGQGSQLFSGYVGDYFAILGLPLLPLMNALREFGVLPT